MKYKIEDIRSIGSLNITDGVRLTPVFYGKSWATEVDISFDEFDAIRGDTQKMKEKAIQVLNAKTYNGKLSADQQITAEEGIAAIIFSFQGVKATEFELDEDCTLHEEDCQVLSKSILLQILSEFRPDLVN